MLFDVALDGVEDPGGEISHTLGMVNLDPLDWFTPFTPGLAREPGRGFRHP